MYTVCVCMCMCETESMRYCMCVCVCVCVCVRQRICSATVYKVILYPNYSKRVNCHKSETEQGPQRLCRINTGCTSGGVYVPCIIYTHAR